MYLEEIYLENTGPISKCHVKPPFDDNGNPLPLVIVGPNGSGKSIFLSYIVDALTEFAKPFFDDIVRLDNPRATPYFRIIGPTTIRSGEPFSISLLRFKAADKGLYYREKAGTLDRTTYSPELKPTFAPVWNWTTDESKKYVSADKSIDRIRMQEIIETEMRKGAHAFFPARRCEEPDWLNPKSLKVKPNPVSTRFERELGKPLWIETCAEENIPWILDVFLDSLIDLLPGLQLAEGQNLIYRNVSSSEIIELRNRSLLRQARQNVESILQAILQDGSAKLDLNYRNVGPSRISIKMKDGRIIPTLQSLSEGQSQLFHLFATIIRYGERADINMSIRLRDITGLVIIDEIASHLHPTLQHDVLPRLIRMFPKVQFIVSSHSPLFLLGMEKRFGSDGLSILELPDGDRINSERFSEFGRAFEYYQTTERFEEEIEKRFADMTKPVVLTEGKTDAQYIQTALELLGATELLNSLEIKPVGKEGDDGDRGGGKSGLDKFRDVYTVKPSFFHQPILLLYDWDACKSAEQIERLWIRTIPKNDADAEKKGGIENLFSSHLFKDCFYEKRPKKGIHGKSNEIHEFKKPEFCKWICEHGSAADFEGFKEVVNILKEFVNAHQPPSGQQPAPE